MRTLETTANGDTLWVVDYDLDGLRFVDVVALPSSDLGRVRAGLAKGHGVAARRVIVWGAWSCATLADAFDLLRAVGGPAFAQGANVAVPPS